MGPQRVPFGAPPPPQVQSQQQQTPSAWGTFFGAPYPIYMPPARGLMTTVPQQLQQHPSSSYLGPAAMIPMYTGGATVYPIVRGPLSIHPPQPQQLPKESQVPPAVVPSNQPVFPAQSVGGFRLGGLPVNHIRTGSNRVPIGGWKSGELVPKVGDSSTTTISPAPVGDHTGREASTTAEHLAIDSLSLQNTTLKNFNSLPPMEMEGPGFRLMQQMGYRPGEGLGKRSNGPLEPLKVQVKLDTKGFAASDERVPGKKGTMVRVLPWDLGEKNPVSQLLEVCQSRGWTMPQFDYFEEGPPNGQRWICTARLNGVDYRSAISAKRKKDAKVDACLVIINTLKSVALEKEAGDAAAARVQPTFLA